jgi:hypothetical protein
MVIHLGITLLAIMLTASTTTAQEKAKIYLGASSKTLGYSPLWVATKKGLFEQQGLDVQLVLLRGMPMTVQALAAGSLQRDRSIHHCWQELQNLRRFTGCDLRHRIFNRRYHHRIARSIEGQGA